MIFKEKIKFYTKYFHEYLAENEIYITSREYYLYKQLRLLKFPARRTFVRCTILSADTTISKCHDSIILVCSIYKNIGAHERVSQMYLHDHVIREHAWRHLWIDGKTKFKVLGTFKI